ncbi:NAD(P)/FAD-dependent oxidoreductase [Apilactobacillus zhangqiuensis]|uniref:NAD(P)/FAD-dependent oxidoreductase n=1 Tax=Apilactobacillus zhangqiuensis TaxID=2841031 RepID=UPI001C7D3E2B|nr:FAD-dependent oxidoreductase [Apilactobacillus zhangqiuensis]
MTKKIAIIGGGIVGSTAAYFLSQLDSGNDFDVTMFDDGNGQATKAAAGIISPWLSKRRNKKWYNLARDGATLLKQISKQSEMPESIYNQCGTIITRDDATKLKELYQLAEERKEETDTIGEIKELTVDEVMRFVPIIDSSYPGVFVSGGARLNGDKYSSHLTKIAKRKNLTVINQTISINKEGNIEFDGQEMQFDDIILATGAWTKDILKELPLDVDVRPQKGQLIELSTTQILGANVDMPVVMPEGESDFIPLGNGRLIVGASHEDDKGFDLSADADVIDDLLNSAHSMSSQINAENLIRVKIGTRAYTSDFAPFFGRIPGYEKILVGSGLGSSGLTTGPLVGKILAEMIADKVDYDIDEYRKPIENYIKLVK